MIKVNGEELQLEDLTVVQLLETLGYQERVAVECNEVIVPKSQYESYVVHSGDVVEVVSFVGGG